MGGGCDSHSVPVLLPPAIASSLSITGDSIQESSMLQSRGTGTGSETLWLPIWLCFLPQGPFYPYLGEASPVVLGSPVWSPKEMMART